VTRPADDNQILPLIHGYLMACLTHMRKTLRSGPAELDRMRRKPPTLMRGGELHEDTQDRKHRIG